VGKAEFTAGEANPRFVVTSLKRSECKAKYLYERIYCARGDMENRIKECQLDLYADRTSTATMRANQLRLWFASMAYVLMCAVRRIGLHHRVSDRRRSTVAITKERSTRSAPARSARSPVGERDRGDAQSGPGSAGDRRLRRDRP
jgi:Transposase DDE domain group 1